jgi:hypothetical protein
VAGGAPGAGARERGSSGRQSGAACFPGASPKRCQEARPSGRAEVLKRYQRFSWYSWGELNHRPPDPQSGALNQLCYTCGVGEQCLAPRGPWRRAGVAIADGC